MLTTFRTEPALRPVFLADAAANAAWAVTLAVLTGLGLVVGRKAGAGEMLVGAAVSVNYAAALFSGWLPLLCRRWPLGGVMMALRLLASLSLLPMVFFPSLTTLMIGYTGVLLLGGISDAAYPALLNVVYPGTAHTRVMSLIFTIRALAAFLLTMLIGWLLTGQPLEAAIRTLGGLCLFGFLAVAAMWRFRGVREEPAAEEHDASGAQPAGEDTGAPGIHPLRNRAFLWYLLALTFFGSGGIIGTVAWPVMVADANAFALTLGQAGILAALMSVAQMGAYLYMSRRGRVGDENRQLTLPYTLTAVNMTISLLLLALGIRGSLAFLLLLPGLIVTNIGNGLQAVYFYLVVNAMAGRGAVLRYQAVQNVAVGIRGVLVPLAAGWLLVAAGLIPTIITAVALMLAGAVLAWIKAPGSTT